MSLGLWVLLFVVIAVGGAAVLVWLGLRIWRKAGALLGEVDGLAGRVGELAGLLGQVEVPVDPSVRQGGSEAGWDVEEAWPGTVETYDDRGADAPGKRER